MSPDQSCINERRFIGVNRGFVLRNKRNPGNLRSPVIKTSIKDIIKPISMM